MTNRYRYVAIPDEGDACFGRIRFRYWSQAFSEGAGAARVLLLRPEVREVEVLVLDGDETRSAALVTREGTTHPFKPPMDSSTRCRKLERVKTLREIHGWCLRMVREHPIVIGDPESHAIVAAVAQLIAEEETRT